MKPSELYVKKGYIVLNLALFCGIHEKYAVWKFMVDVVHDFGSSLRPDVGRGFLHVSNVSLLYLGMRRDVYIHNRVPSKY